MYIVGYQSSKLSVIPFAIWAARNSEIKEMIQVEIIAVKAIFLLILPEVMAYRDDLFCRSQDLYNRSKHSKMP